MKKYLLLFPFFFSSCSTKNNNESLSVKGTSLAFNKADKSKKGSDRIDSSFLSFWDGFFKIIRTKNLQEFRNNSLDSVERRQDRVTISEFMKLYTETFNDTLLSKISDTTKVYFISNEVESFSFSSPVLQYDSNNKRNVIIQAYIEIGYNVDGGPILIRLEFVKTKFGYKFYGYDNFG